MVIAMNVLVLNSSYMPAGVIDWRKSIKLLFMNKADIIEPSEYMIKGINRDYVIPDVIRLKYYSTISYTSYKYCRTIFIKETDTGADIVINYSK